MSTFYLINCVTVASTKVFAGDLINDAVDDASGIRNAGGLLWPSSNAIIGTAALKAQNARLNKGASEIELNELMQSAVDALQLVADEGVATLAALTASDDSVAFTTRMVGTVLRPYQLDKTSSATVDGISVVATASGVGRWLAIFISVPHWSTQLNWEVDSVLGNDENSGIFGASAPLKTAREFCRRVRTCNAGTVYTVNIAATGLPTTDTLRFNPIVNGDGAGTAIVIFKGIITNAVSSAFSASAATVAATSTQANVTDPLNPWAANLGKLITMTSGAANGAVAQILADLGANTARVTNWVFPLTGVFSATPAALDTYVIKTLPVSGATPGGQSLTARCSLRCQDLQLTSAVGVGLVGDMQFFACHSLNTAWFPQAPQLSFTNFFGCAMQFTVLTTLFGNTNPEGIQFFGGGFLNCSCDVSVYGGAVFRSVFQGSRVRHNPGSNAMGGDVFFNTMCGFFDWPAGGPAVELRRGMRGIIQPPAGATGLYGTSATGTFGVTITEDSVLFLPATTTPVITGPSGDLNFDGMTTAYQQLELHTGALAAAVVVPLTTWANLVAAVVLNVSGFARNVLSYKSGAKIVSNA